MRRVNRSSSSKRKRAVAADARVRRLAARVARGERLDDGCRNCSRRSSVTCGIPSRWQVSRAAITAAGEQQTRSLAADVRDRSRAGASRRRRPRPPRGAPPRCRPRRSSRPPSAPASARARIAGPIAFASASTASVSPADRRRLEQRQPDEVALEPGRVGSDDPLPVDLEPDGGPVAAARRISEELGHRGQRSFRCPTTVREKQGTPFSPHETTRGDLRRPERRCPTPVQTAVYRAPIGVAYSARAIPLAEKQVSATVTRV